MKRIKQKRERRQKDLTDVDTRVFRTEREQREAKKFAKRQLHTTNRRHVKDQIRNEDWEGLENDADD